MLRHARLAAFQFEAAFDDCWLGVVGQQLL
jgi:hypothetical protein